MSYAKLFSTITESSLWGEPKEVRLLFVSMLARADATGFVEAAIPGLARMSNLTDEETRSALKCLNSPDSDSKNKTDDGRRVIEVPGGWMILNYEEYRNRRDEDARREYMRSYMKEYRASRKQVLTPVNSGKPPLAQAEAEAEAEAEEKIICPNARAVVHYLNEKTGSKFRESNASFKHICPRLEEKDVTIDGVKQMIDHQCKLWKGTTMEKYLRPSTLFNETRFNEYYASKDQPVIHENASRNGSQNNPRPDHETGF